MCLAAFADVIALAPPSGIAPQHARAWGCRGPTKTAPVGSGAVCVTMSCRLPRRGSEICAALRHRQHDDLGADVDAGVEIRNVVIGQTDAAGGDVLADGVG